jgi:hypothetical protein
LAATKIDVAPLQGEQLASAHASKKGGDRGRIHGATGKLLNRELDLRRDHAS